MKNLLILCCFLCGLPARSQVTTDPQFPSADAPVTIIYDATKGSAGLRNSATVYMHAGAILSGATGTTWENVVGNWGKADGIGAMTQDAADPNLWRITLTPRTYFKVAADKTIFRIGMVFREAGPCGATGQAACKEGKSDANGDIFANLFASGLQLTFTEPKDTFLLVEPNTVINVQAAASQTAALTLFNGNQSLAQTTGTALAFALNVGASGSGMVRVEGVAGGKTLTDSFEYLVKTPSITAAAPAGVRDGINYRSLTSAVLQLFAPLKQTVYLIGDFNDWKPSAAYQLKRTPDGNRFWIELSGLVSGQEYAFQYLVDNNIRVGDPYCDKILDPLDRFIPVLNYPNPKPYPNGKTSGTVSVLQTGQPAYAWQTNAFQRPANEKLNVYELLVRDFVGTRSYKTIMDTLPYLKRLGINAIELMPVMEFAGNDSWGYNPIYYFAPDKAYGTKNDLKAFVDKCHQNGIAVILDMVLNQADYEYPYVKMYWDTDKPAANSPYFNPQATHPFSVFFDFNHESAATKALVDTVSRYWLREYKLDGFRFDLSKGFTQKNTGGDVAAWSAKDDSRIAIWKRIYDRIRQADPTAYVILEHLGANDEEKILADYGMMLWGNQQPNYKEAALGYDNEKANLNWSSYRQRGWNNPNLIAYMESHDEERLMVEQLLYGNTNPTTGYNTKQLATALDRMKLVAALYFSIPGPKMLWQFGELGYDVSINENGRTGAKPLKWNYYADANRLKLYKVYAELMKLRATQPAFHSRDFTLDADGKALKQLQLNDAAMKVTVIANTDVKSAAIMANFQQNGTWYDYFTGNALEVTAASRALTLQPGEFHIYTTTKLATPEAGLVPNWAASPTAVEDEALERATTVYPNPNGGTFRVVIENDSRGAIQLQLTDLAGRRLQSATLNKTQPHWHYDWQTDRLAAGIYLLEITGGKGKTVKRVVKR